MTALTVHFHEQLKKFVVDTQGLAVALSGGADSWALALLAHAYAAANDLKFIALTVDHRLRPDSAAEAAMVAAACAQRGIPQATLVWEHGDITSRKQELARTARYALLADYCGAHDFTHLLTAHHADDQAETVLLRFAKGSGAKGLSGMAARRPLSEKLTLIRPLLSIPKANLTAYAAAAGVPIAADPSNENPAYARPRLRAARAALEAEGLTTGTLLKVAATAQVEDAAMAYATQTLLLDQAVASETTATLPLGPWLAAPLALQMRALTTLWRQLVGDTGYPPERDAMARLCDALTERACRRTLGGLMIERKGDTITLQPEFAAES